MLNDELNVVRIIGDVEVTLFRIFDRWGNKVFETDSSDVGWDGTFNGKGMPSDVYVYLVEIQFPDGTNAVQKGEVSLIR
jgi:gliding motility-associated-like protein